MWVFRPVETSVKFLQVYKAVTNNGSSLFNVQKVLYFRFRVCVSIDFFSHHYCAVFENVLPRKITCQLNCAAGAVMSVYSTFVCIKFLQ